MASFQLCEGSRRGCVPFACASGFPSKGNAGPHVERISHIVPVSSLKGKIVGPTAEHMFPLYRCNWCAHPGIRIARGT